MTIVNVATLKEKLSYYLGLVKPGQEVVVTSGGKRNISHERSRCVGIVSGKDNNKARLSGEPKIGKPNLTLLGGHR